MAVSTAAQNMFLGPVYVYYNGMALGRTKGGIEITNSITTADMSSDQDGIVDKTITEQSATVKIPLAEVGLQNLASVTGFTFQQKSTAQVVAIKSLIGIRASSNAYPLILKKPSQTTLGTPSTNENDWITFPYAWPDGNITLKYSNEQTIYEATFFAVPDSNNVRYYVGSMGAYS